MKYITLFMFAGLNTFLIIGISAFMQEFVPNVSGLPALVIAAFIGSVISAFVIRDRFG